MNAPAIFEMRSELPVPAEVAFAWHERSGALERLTPPWETMRVVERHGTIRDGDRITIAVKIGPLWKTWLAEHRNFVAGEQFQDVQLRGPFAQFEHTHKILRKTNSTCELIDHIEFRPPGGTWGMWMADSFIRRKLTRAFRYRHAVTKHDLRQIYETRKGESMKILVSGATGLVGSEVVPALSTAGHEVFKLGRRPPRDAHDLQWNPETGSLPAARLEGIDAVVHLAGENIAGARWTDSFKRKLRESRINGTRLLCESLAKLQARPKVLICASAIGFYGNRGTEELRETSAIGTGFLPELCSDWEAACEPARACGIRVVNLRIGVVLSPKGGALSKMLFPFRMGGGGIVGSGDQYWSWVAIDDVVGAILHALNHEELSGPVNVVSPSPATNREFTKTLGAVLHRPTIFPMPAFVARLLLGEMADDLLLGSNRVLPERLTASEYQFRCPTLACALNHVLGKDVVGE